MKSTRYPFSFCLRQWWAMMGALFYFKRWALFGTGIFALVVGLMLGGVARTLSDPQSAVFQAIDQKVNPETIVEMRLGVNPQKAIQDFQNKPQSLQYADIQGFSHIEQDFWHRFQAQTTFYEDRAHPFPEKVKTQLEKRGIRVTSQSANAFTHQAQAMRTYVDASNAHFYIFCFWMQAKGQTSNPSIDSTNPVLGFLLLTDLKTETLPSHFQKVSALDVYTHLFNDVFKEKGEVKTISWPMRLQTPSVESKPLFPAVDPQIHAHNWVVLMFELYGLVVLGACSWGFFMALPWGIEREHKRLEIWALSPLPMWVLTLSHVLSVALSFAGFFTLVGLCLWGMTFSLVGWRGLGYLAELSLISFLGSALTGAAGIFTVLYFRHPWGRAIAQLWTLPLLLPLYGAGEAMFMMQIWRSTSGLTQRVWELPSLFYMVMLSPLLVLSLLGLMGWMERKIGRRREGLRA